MAAHLHNAHNEVRAARVLNGAKREGFGVRPAKHESKALAEEVVRRMLYDTRHRTQLPAPANHELAGRRVLMSAINDAHVNFPARTFKLQKLRLPLAPACRHDAEDAHIRRNDALVVVLGIRPRARRVLFLLEYNGARMTIH